MAQSYKERIALDMIDKGSMDVVDRLMDTIVLCEDKETRVLVAVAAAVKCLQIAGMMRLQATGVPKPSEAMVKGATRAVARAMMERL